jgi:RNA polymerase sigma-70 factor (ECF subfamily)
MQNNPYIQELDLRELHQDAVQWAMYCTGYDTELGREVVQQAYLKIVEGSARFERTSTLKTWLFGVIRLTALECRRKQNLHRVADAAFGEPDMQPGPDRSNGDYAEAFTSRAISDALETLSRMQREIIYLAFYRELTLSEIADIHGVSIGTVRTQYHRAKQKLGNLLTAGEHNGKVTAESHQ